jgi:hypothetical protein
VIKLNRITKAEMIFCCALRSFSKSKIKSPPSKNVDRLSMPKNVPPEAQFHLKMVGYYFISDSLGRLFKLRLGV